MKIQILELPMEPVGEVTSTPFVLVLSEMPPEDAAAFAGQTERIRELTGARGVLTYYGIVEI
jgi:hypothetical protein